MHIVDWFQWKGKLVENIGVFLDELVSLQKLWDRRTVINSQTMGQQVTIWGNRGGNWYTMSQSAQYIQQVGLAIFVQCAILPMQYTTTTKLCYQVPTNTSNSCNLRSLQNYPVKLKTCLKGLNCICRLFKSLLGNSFTIWHILPS